MFWTVFFFLQIWVIGCPLSSLWVAIDLNVWEGPLECAVSSGNTQLALQIIKRNQLLPMTVQRISPDSRKKPVQPLHSLQQVQLPSSFTQVQRKWTSLAACTPVTCFLSTSVPPKKRICSYWLKTRDFNLTEVFFLVSMRINFIYYISYSVCFIE